MWNPRSLGLCLSLFSLLACKTLLKPSDNDPAATASTKPVNPDTPKTPEAEGASDKPPVSSNQNPTVEEPNLGGGNPSNVDTGTDGSNSGTGGSNAGGGTTNPGTGGGTGGSNAGGGTTNPGSGSGDSGTGGGTTNPGTGGGTTNPGTGGGTGGSNAGGGTTNPGSGSGDSGTGGGTTNPGSGSGDSGSGSGGSVSCVDRVINFEKRPDGKRIQRGEQISKQYADWGIEITSHRVKADNQWDENRPPIIFDSAERPNASKRKEYQRISKAQGNNDDGFDSDLMTAKNRNVLIIAENYYSEGASSLVAYPDDNYWGGRLVFVFQKPAKVKNVEVIDNESDAAKLEFRDQFNALKYTQKVVGKQNGNLQNIAIGNSGFIRSMTLTLPSGGAVDNVRLCIEK